MPSTSLEPTSPPALFPPVYIVSNWLKKEDADALLAYAIASEHRFTEATIYHSGSLQVDHAVRKAATLSDLGPFASLLHESTLALIPELETHLHTAALTLSNLECELAAHGDGAHFNRHADAFPGDTSLAGTRALTLVYYLNREPKPYTGGALRLYATNTTDTKDIEPTHNRLVAFPSIADHSVQTIHCPGNHFRDRRFAVNIWLHHQPA